MNFRPSGVATTHTSHPSRLACSTRRPTFRDAGDPQTIAYRTGVEVTGATSSYSNSHMFGEFRDLRRRGAPGTPEDVAEHLTGYRPATDLGGGQSVPFDQHVTGFFDVTH